MILAPYFSLEYISPASVHDGSHSTKRLETRVALLRAACNTSDTNGNGKRVKSSLFEVYTNNFKAKDQQISNEDFWIFWGCLGLDPWSCAIFFLFVLAQHKKVIWSPREMQLIQNVDDKNDSSNSEFNFKFANFNCVILKTCTTVLQKYNFFFTKLN